MERERRKGPPPAADETVSLAQRGAGITRAQVRSAELARELSVDIVHQTETTDHGRPRPMKVYERFVYKVGKLEMYFLFHPGLGITTEERAAMRGFAP